MKTLLALVALFASPAAFADAYLNCASPIGQAASIGSAGKDGTNRFRLEIPNSTLSELPAGQSYQLTGAFTYCESSASSAFASYCSAGNNDTPVTLQAIGLKDGAARTLTLKFVDLSAKEELITGLGGPHNFVMIDLMFQETDGTLRKQALHFAIPLPGSAPSSPSQCL